MFKIVDRSRNISTPKAEEAFRTATTYLKRSDLARFIMEQFEKSRSKTVVKVEVYPNRGGGNSWEPPAWKKGELGGTVFWEASRTEAGYQQFGSAAMALMHELGHAYQYLSEKKRMRDILKPKLSALSPALKRKIGSGDDFLNKIELTNTQAIELTVANEINKEIIFARGPRYKWLEPIREHYLKEGRPATKRLPNKDEITHYLTQLRQEHRSPTPVFQAAIFDPRASHYLTLM